MKKIIAIVSAIVVFAAMSSTAFAAPLYDTGSGSSLQAVQLDATSGTKQDNLAFRQTVLKDREAILSNAQKNTDLVFQNRQLRDKIKQTIASIKQNGEKLTSDTKTQLKEYNTQLKTLTASLKDTKGQLKTAMDAFKAAVKAKDSSALQTAFGQATTVQNNRNDLLTQINGVLQKISDLVSSAGAAASATPHASATASTTT